MGKFEGLKGRKARCFSGMFSFLPGSKSRHKCSQGYRTFWLWDRCWFIKLFRSTGNTQVFGNPKVAVVASNGSRTLVLGMLWPRPDRVVRPRNPAGRRPVLGTCDLLELEVALIAVAAARSTGTARLSGKQPVLHQALSYFVGRRCRQASISDVAKELALDWHTVKALEVRCVEGAAGTRRHAGSPGHRDRRGPDKVILLSDRGQRSSAASTDLV